MRAAGLAPRVFAPVRPVVYGEMAWRLYTDSIPNTHHNALDLDDHTEDDYGDNGDAEQRGVGAGRPALRCAGCNRVVTCSCGSGGRNLYSEPRL